METVTDFIFLGFKITADGDCSYEIKRHLLIRRKVMTNLDSIFKSRDITLPAKVHLVRAMVFPVVMYGCEGWTVKKAESRRIDAFELWCWRRLFEIPMDCKEIQPVHPKGNHSWIFIGRTDTLAIWCKPWCWERLKARGEGDDRVWDGWIGSLTQWTWVWVTSGSWWWTENLGMLQSMGLQRVGHDWVTELNWTELMVGKSGLQICSTDFHCGK